MTSRRTRSSSVGAAPRFNPLARSRAESAAASYLEVRCACQFFQSDSLLPERINPVSSPVSSRPTSPQGNYAGSILPSAAKLDELLRTDEEPQDLNDSIISFGIVTTTDYYSEQVSRPNSRADTLTTNESLSNINTAAVGMPSITLSKPEFCSQRSLDRNKQSTLLQRYQHRGPSQDPPVSRSVIGSAAHIEDNLEGASSSQQIVNNNSYVPPRKHEFSSQLSLDRVKQSTLLQRYKPSSFDQDRSAAGSAVNIAESYNKREPSVNVAEPIQRPPSVNITESFRREPSPIVVEPVKRESPVKKTESFQPAPTLNIAESFNREPSPNIAKVLPIEPSVNMEDTRREPSPNFEMYRKDPYSDIIAAKREASVIKETAKREPFLAGDRTVKRTPSLNFEQAIKRERSVEPIMSPPAKKEVSSSQLSLDRIKQSALLQRYKPHSFDEAKTTPALAISAMKQRPYSFDQQQLDHVSSALVDEEDMPSQIDMKNEPYECRSRFREPNAHTSSSQVSLDRMKKSTLLQQKYRSSSQDHSSVSPAVNYRNNFRTIDMEESKLTGKEATPKEYTPIAKPEFISQLSLDRMKQSTLLQRYKPKSESQENFSPPHKDHSSMHMQQDDHVSKTVSFEHDKSRERSPYVGTATISPDDHRMSPIIFQVKDRMAKVERMSYIR